MKDNGHTYFFCAMFDFDNKYNLGARLDQIRSNGIVTVVWGQFEKIPHTGDKESLDRLGQQDRYNFKEVA